MASRKKPIFTNPKPCPHLSSYREKHGLTGYKSLQKSLRSSPSGRTALSRLQSKNHTCSSCPNTSIGRLYFCLICSSISCPSHAASHSISSPGHDISVDVERAELFCLSCTDQVYDPDFDSAVVAAAAKILNPPLFIRQRKPHMMLLPPISSFRGIRSALRYPWGLRGLNNLGNTCFMNSVLQALFHTPPLRNYFLGDHHKRVVCRQRRRRRGAVAAGGGEGPCLACVVEGVFSEVFSGDRKPYSPASFLYSWWRHSSNLSGYEQQDAHEFFISILDRIHDKEQSGLNTKGIVDCHCIAHSVFSGILRSDVTCTVCGFTSTTYDPCIDISLDLETVYGTDIVPGKSATQAEKTRISTLTGCLDLFTRPEKLGSDQKLYCQNCGVKQDSVKQMSIRRLPLVLCFHVKRFAHSVIQKTSKKIDQYMQFPFSLDMTPYLSSSIIRNRFGNRIFAFEGDESDLSGEISSEFEVFAVVTHSGRLDSGHYVTYLRIRNQWYKCDDAWVTEVSEEVVRALQGYMIYYVQKFLYHRAGEERVIPGPGCLLNVKAASISNLL